MSKQMFVGILTNVADDLDDMIEYLKPAKDLEAECAWEIPSMIAQLKELVDEVESMIQVEIKGR